MENMGTYTRIVLKDQSEKKMLKINQEILSLGYRDELRRGPFFTMEHLLDDIQYMNEDPKGLKQREDLKRPITPEQFLSSLSYWSALGLFFVKISCLNEEEMYNLKIVMQWSWRNKEKIDEVESEYWTERDALNYNVFSVAEIATLQH